LSTSPGVGELLLAAYSEYDMPVIFSAPTGTKIKLMLTIEALVPGSACYVDIWRMNFYRHLCAWVPTGPEPIESVLSMTSEGWTQINRNDPTTASFLVSLLNKGKLYSGTGYTAFRYDAVGSSLWSDYKLDVAFEYKADNPDDFGFGFRWTDAGGYWIYQVHNPADPTHPILTLAKSSNQNLVDSSTVLWSGLGDAVAGSLSVIAQGATLMVFLNGILRAVVMDSTYMKGSVGAVVHLTGFWIDSIVVTQLGVLEEVSTANVIVVNDLGIGTEVPLVLALVDVEDSGVGTDVIVSSFVASKISVSDAGALLAETLSLVIGVVVNDSGHAVDTPFILSSGAVVEDAGVGTDTVNVFGSVYVYDSGIEAAEVLYILRKIPIYETGHAEDVIVGIFTWFELRDDIVGHDEVSVFASFGLEDSGQETEEILSIVGRVFVDDFGIAIYDLETVEKFMYIGTIWDESALGDSIRGESPFNKL
jgi:hypothetical protein